MDRQNYANASAREAGLTPDYRKFLGKKVRAVLPYVGGKSVITESGSFRIGEKLKPGFYIFELSGRVAHAISQAETPDLSKLPKIRGHLFEQSIVVASALTETLHFLRDTELARFSPVIARRWYSGELVFECVDFETDAERIGRRAYEDEAPLAGVSGVPATLRAAFAYAVATRESERLGIPCRPIEIRRWVFEISQEGCPRAATCLRELARHREAYEREHGTFVRAVRELPDRADEARVEAALSNTGARLCELRRLEGGLLRVRYEFFGNRFATVVKAESLQVVDAGICLDGEGGSLTLHNLPGVVREAMETNQLVVTWSDD